MRIDRCYCFDVCFQELQAAAVEHGAASVAELQECVRFGENCRLCHPYVRRMLRTGEILFSEIVTETDADPEAVGEPEEPAAG